MAAEVRRETRYELDLALILLDVDRFKKFNDEHGHRTGDRVLACIGSIIEQQFRDIDTGARYGGEEFAVITPSTGLEEAELLAERIRRVVDVQLSSEGVTISAGVVAVGGSIADADTLIHAAHATLYRSKQAGRNQPTPWAPSLTL